MKSRPRYRISALLICLLPFFALAGKPGKTPLQLNTADIYLTAKNTNDRLAFKEQRAFEPLEQPDENYPTIILDADKTFQTIEGFGGAFTDAASETFGKLPLDKQQEFLTAVFDPLKGNGSSLCRTTIHSCDYSGEMYTYDDTPGDKELKNFSIEHDRKYRIPFIKQALKACGNKLKIFASPWSPPAWMKTNNNMLYGGKLKPEYFQIWANYFVKYIKAYESEGIPIWGVSVQNEPMAVQIWESCIFTADEEAAFVRDYLGPAFEKAGLSRVKIMIWDHNRGIMYQRAKAAYDDPAASKYIWGMAFHWYVGDHYDNVRQVHDAYPDKNLLFAEGGMGSGWDTAENVAKNIIIDLNNWTNGWTYWNMMVDENGGPNHVGGHGGEMMRGNVEKGEISIFPPYYYFGHFSRFLRPGAKRIVCTSNHDELQATAFLNPDGKVVVIVQNRTDIDKLFQVWINNKVVKYTSPGHSLMNVVF